MKDKKIGLLAILTILITPVLAEARTVYVDAKLAENPSFKPALELVSDAASLIGRGFDVKTAYSGLTVTGNDVYISPMSGGHAAGPMVTLNKNSIQVEYQYYKWQTDSVKKELFVHLLHELGHTFGIWGHTKHGLMSEGAIPGKYTYFWDPEALEILGYDKAAAQILYDSGRTKMHTRLVETGYLKR